MELIRNIQSHPLSGSGCVATIGNFDGVHLGHQSVIRQLISCARAKKLSSVVVTFEPLPMEFFSPKTAPARLSEFREKLDLLSGLSVDKVVCLRFNQSLASLTAETFVKEILVQGLKLRSLIVGDDFRFGNKREGNIALLREAGLEYGFDVIHAETYYYSGIRISSSLIRGHLAMGDFELVKELLGRSFHIDGKVIHGDKRGRELGFPTANMACRRINYPLSGIFAVRVHGLHNRTYEGVANIGTRPVFNGDKLLLETHIFDFNQDIYGSRISVEFMKKIRDEQNFDSIEALCEQMGKDVSKARQYFSNL